jgi:hypothetical protein
MGASPTAKLGTPKPGSDPVRSHATSHRGLIAVSNACSRTVVKSIFDGTFGLPQSRLCTKDQSSVRMMPTAPALRARSRRAIIESRSPAQYSWNSVCGLAATTSSIGMLANELSPITTPRAAAARATATSPPGCTACTPVGEMSTGIDIGWPITVVERSRSGGCPAVTGRSISSSKAAVLSASEMPLSAPAISAP